MLLSRRLPRWQLRYNVNTARSFRHSIRSQQNSQQVSGQPHSSSPSPDPIESLRTRVQASESTRNLPPSFARRFTRGVFYAIIFSVTGFAVAWGWNTYQYLRIGQVLDNPKLRQRDREWFISNINRSTLVQSLRKEGWVEEDPKQHELNIEEGAVKTPGTSQGRHFVYERLDNDGYLVEKHFRHPTEQLTVVVFMAGFGCESWPNTLHGGVATTVIQDALDTHVKNFPDYAAFRKRDTTMNYKMPLHTGTLYSVLVQNDQIEGPPKYSKAAKAGLMGVGASFEIRRMINAPQYIEKHDEKTGVSSRICKTYNSQDGMPPFVKGGSILLLAPKSLRGTIGKITGDISPELQTKFDAWMKLQQGIRVKEPIPQT